MIDVLKRFFASKAYKVWAGVPVWMSASIGIHEIWRGSELRSSWRLITEIVVLVATTVWFIEQWPKSKERELKEACLLVTAAFGEKK